MQGTVVQLSISAGGMPKLPLHEALATPLGLEGDRHAHPKYHGGPRQALLLISAEDVAHLAAQGYPVFPGALGENVTVEGLDFRQLRLAQRLRIGPVTVEITKLRVPCELLDVFNSTTAPGRIQDEVYDASVKAGDSSSPRWGRGGYYAAVLTPGILRVGDPVVPLEQLA